VPCARHLPSTLSTGFRAVKNAACRTCASFLSPAPAPFQSTFLPSAFSLGTQDHYLAGFRLRNVPWKFRLVCFSKFCFGTRRNALCPWSADVTSTRYIVSLLFFVFSVLSSSQGRGERRVGIGGFSFILVVSPWQLRCFTSCCIILLRITVFQYTLLYIVIFSLLFCLFSTCAEYTHTLFLLKNLPLYFGPHLEMGFAPSDPRPIIDCNMAQLCGWKRLNVVAGLEVWGLWLRTLV
jgi:hypothetical protein